MNTRAHTDPRFYLNGFVAKPEAPAHDPYLYVGNIATGDIKRRSPKNQSISRGINDGIGAFPAATTSIATPDRSDLTFYPVRRPDFRRNERHRLLCSIGES